MELATEPLMKECYEIRLRSLGEAHFHIGSAHRQMGTLAWARGDYETAMDHLQQAINIHGKALGEDHYHVGMDKVFYGHNLVEAGRIEEGAETLQQGLALIKASASASRLDLTRTITFNRAESPQDLCWVAFTTLTPASPI